MAYAKTSIGIRIKIKDFIPCLTEENFYSFYGGIIGSFIEENNSGDDIKRKNLHRHMLFDITNFYDINRNINKCEIVKKTLSNDIFEDIFIIMPMKDILSQNSWNKERKGCHCDIETINDYINIVKEKMDELDMSRTNYIIVYTLLVENHN